MKKLGKKLYEVKETLESYSCAMTCLCNSCTCTCNPSTCGGNTSSIASTGSSTVGSTSSDSVNTRNLAFAND